MSASAITLHNVTSYIRHPESGRDLFCRLPSSVRVCLNPGAREKSLMTAGVEIRCRAQGRGGGVRLFIAGTQPIRAELYQGDFLLWPLVIPPGEQDVPLAGQYTWSWLSHQQPPGTSTHLLQSLPGRRFDPGLLRLVLPYRALVGPVRTRGELSPARPQDLPDRTLLCYGSSITQGYEALTATGGYAPRLARLLGMDLINLGLAGSAHLEPEIATHIAERSDWHIATLELGINLVGTLEPQAFARRAAEFVAIVARAARPVFVLDLFRYFDDFSGGDAGRAQAFREAVAAAAHSAGSHVRHISVSHLPDPQGLCADLLHPSPEGMEQMAGALAGAIRPYLMR